LAARAVRTDINPSAHSDCVVIYQDSKKNGLFITSVYYARNSGDIIIQVRMYGLQMQSEGKNYEG
jgi:hypothetical protein